MPTTPPPKKPKTKLPLTDYVKYSAMSFQMLAIIGLGGFLGVKLDEKLQFKKIPVFTLVFALSFSALAIYLFVRDFLKKK